MTQQPFSRPGAIDLSGLKRPPAGAPQGATGGGGAAAAGGSSYWLDITQEDGAIEVRARDDGHGAEAVAAGRGLAGMRERLESAGGKLEVSTRPGMGFAVAALVPVRRGA